MLFRSVSQSRYGVFVISGLLLGVIDFVGVLVWVLVGVGLSGCLSGGFVLVGVLVIVFVGV